MAEDLITSDNLSVDTLRATFEAAYMDVSLSESGHLRIRDACIVLVIPDMERRNRIRLMSVFGFKDGTSPIDRLQCVNRINDEYIMVCASTTNDGLLLFRYDLMLDGGLPRKALVLAVKRFASIPHGAIQEHGAGIVE
ncbi:YbjN domain-containing protein [Rhodocaloribacter litoris]|uniref:YbjN domain-containing protein n=1 Tax=Rhodocaloribacter litoris TaxID=2558931 RepID=UPI001421E253|nr:YbjN domain-containing protein [Rhodocaloribacter litoris]QXD14111.1 YbjN domain-containing protein [Rhodocaloribacter litoris]